MKQTREFILNEIKKTLQTVAPNAKAILFGSRARNEARADSDWDILILVDKDKICNEDFDTIAYPLVELGWTLGEMINPVLYTFSEWSKRSFTIFHKNVEEEGVVI
ncbi:nucleotidyltransferase domain-containing protein [Parabacteroides sp. AF48-14]|uniref:nucleotidyltransferase domain-containing protein n=1 Tax=Parabacteroides sp. AF48-14 TaxID=2292052 RepID=UPI000EFE3932|nr:nucleotidyltransferase domain-containing protein [Parabacteroides sp. AF48-14]RHO75232.1 nucleotidyltransferase domain-containing protein [Parabacteroides sp. AF48-14]